MAYRNRLPDSLRESGGAEYFFDKIRAISLSRKRGGALSPAQWLERLRPGETRGGRARLSFDAVCRTETYVADCVVRHRVW